MINTSVSITMCVKSNTVIEVNHCVLLVYCILCSCNISILWHALHFDGLTTISPRSDMPFGMKINGAEMKRILRNINNC